MNIHSLKKFRSVRKIIPLFILLIFIGFGAYFVNQKGGFELRKKAGGINQSMLLFRAPEKVKVGEKFTVDLILDTTGDPSYTISGVDAVVSYSYQVSSNIYPSCAERQCPKRLTKECKDGEMRRPQQDPCACSSYDCVPISQQTTQDVTNIAKKPTMNESAPFYDPFGLLGVQNGTIFDSYPSYLGSDALKIGGFGAGGKLTTISGVKNYAVDEKGHFSGFSGNGVFATFTFLANVEGSMTLSLQYEGDTATNDTNINGFLTNQPASLQKPSERLRQPPENFTIKIISAEINPTPPANCTSWFDGCNTCSVKDGVIAGCTKKACKGRTSPPECRDYTGSSPTPNPPSGCYYESVQCVKAPCSSILVCPSPSVVVSQYPTPTPSVGCKYYPRPCAAFVRDGVTQPTNCGMELVCTTPTPTKPTPTPVPSAGLNIFVESSDGKPVYREVYIYGQRADINRIYPQVQGAQVYAAGFGELVVSTNSSVLETKEVPNQFFPSSPPAPPNPEYNKGFMGGLTFIGSGVTDINGSTTMQIPPQFHGVPWRLFIQTPSHLMRQGYSKERSGVQPQIADMDRIVFKPNVYSDFKFTGLIPGDIFVSKAGAKQDGIINNFDIADLFSAWGPYGRVKMQPPPPAIPQDLNDDGIVNNRDLAIILLNFGKNGDKPGVFQTQKNLLQFNTTTSIPE